MEKTREERIQNLIQQRETDEKAVKLFIQHIEQGFVMNGPLIANGTIPEKVWAKINEHPDEITDSELEAIEMRMHIAQNIKTEFEMASAKLVNTAFETAVKMDNYQKLPSIYDEEID